MDLQSVIHVVIDQKPYIQQLYEYSNEPRCEKTCIERYTSELGQPQKMDRGLTEKTDLSSKNNGAGQMRGYRTADLRLCLRISETSEQYTIEFNSWKNFNHQASQL